MLGAILLAIMNLSLLLGGMSFGLASPIGTIFPHRIVLVLATVVLAFSRDTYRALREFRTPLLVMSSTTLALFLIGTLVAGTLEPVSLVRWVELLWLLVIGLTAGRLANAHAVPVMLGTGLLVLVIAMIDVVVPGAVMRFYGSLSLPRTPEQLQWLMTSFVRGDQQRLQGTFQHALALGAYSATLAIAFLQALKDRLVSAVVGLGGIALCLLVSVLSISRSSVGSVVLIVCAYALLEGVRSIRTKGQLLAAWVAATAILVALAWLIINGALQDALAHFFPAGLNGDASLDQRSDRLQLGTRLFMDAPWLGHGPMYLRNHLIVLDNFALSTVVEGGVLGAVHLSLMHVGTVGFRMRRFWPLLAIGVLQVLAFDFWGFWDAGGAYWLICGAFLATTAGKPNGGGTDLPTRGGSGFAILGQIRDGKNQ